MSNTVLHSSFIALKPLLNVPLNSILRSVDLRGPTWLCQISSAKTGRTREWNLKMSCSKKLRIFWIVVNKASYVVAVSHDIELWVYVTKHANTPNFDAIGLVHIIWSAICFFIVRLSGVNDKNRTISAGVSRLNFVQRYGWPFLNEQSESPLSLQEFGLRLQVQAPGFELITPMLVFERSSPSATHHPHKKNTAHCCPIRRN